MIRIRDPEQTSRIRNTAFQVVFLGLGGACEAFESSYMQSVKVMQNINPVLHTLNYTYNCGQGEGRCTAENGAENILEYFFQGPQQMLWYFS
jgi:hypothetical protein